MIFSRAAILIFATNALAAAVTTPATTKKTARSVTPGAGWAYKCGGSCFAASADDVPKATGEIPTSGQSSADGDTWSYGSAEVWFQSDGYAADYNSIDYGAELIYTNCIEPNGQGSGVAYNVGTNDELEDGCVCVKQVDDRGCYCGGGTPSVGECP